MIKTNKRCDTNLPPTQRKIHFPLKPRCFYTFLNVVWIVEPTVGSLCPHRTLSTFSRCNFHDPSLFSELPVALYLPLSTRLQQYIQKPEHRATQRSHTPINRLHRQLLNQQHYHQHLLESCLPNHPRLPPYLSQNSADGSNAVEPTSLLSTFATSQAPVPTPMLVVSVSLPTPKHVNAPPEAWLDD